MNDLLSIDLFNRWSNREKYRYLSELLNKSVTEHYVLSEEEYNFILKDLNRRKKTIIDFMKIYGCSLDAIFNTFWLGKQVVKSPLDLWMYQEIIYETKPELIIECGTNGSGSAHFFISILNMAGLNNSQVITIDTERFEHLEIKSSQIIYKYGSSLDLDIINECKEMAQGKRTMVSLDSLHTYDHVIKELLNYAELTTPGCYCVVEDTGKKIDDSDFLTEIGGAEGGASKAVDDFLQKKPGIFERDSYRERHLYTSNYGGYLKRIK